MSIESKRVENFCYDEGFLSYTLEKEFEDKDGFIILLTLTRNINKYACRIEELCHPIEVLESWKCENFFKLNKTTYEYLNKECTLPQLKKLYRENKLKYDALYELFMDASRVHYPEISDHLIKKYFSFSN